MTRRPPSRGGLPHHTECVLRCERSGEEGVREGTSLESGCGVTEHLLQRGYRLHGPGDFQPERASLRFGPQGKAQR